MKTDHGIGWHKRGGWYKRFPGDRNQTYFGRVPSADAVRRCVLEQDARASGRAAERETEAKLGRLTVREAGDLFLKHLDGLLESGKIGVVQRASYGDELGRLDESIGNTRLSDLCKMTAPEAIFAPLRSQSMSRGVFAAEKHVSQVRSFLDWCTRVRRFMPPPFYADSFDAPGEKEKRTKTKAVRKEKGVADWTAAEARLIVDAAKATDIHRYAQVLLMLNGGMGASDLSNLEDADIDWDRQCIHTDRSKTLVPRVVPLWDMTRDAMKVSRAARCNPADPADDSRFFLTKKGRPLVVETLKEGKAKTSRTDSIKNWMYALLNAPDRTKWKAQAPRLRDLKRHRAGAYTLRSVFVTLSMGHGQDRNLEAVILGQAFDRPILEFYLRGDLRQKLVGVVEHVRAQIWGDSFGKINTS